MIFCEASKATEGLVRVMECRAVRTRWVGSVRKCFAIGEKGGAVSIFRGSGQERGWREGGE